MYRVAGEFVRIAIRTNCPKWKFFSLSGASALHLAIAYNNMELIKLLVESGAGVEQRAVGMYILLRIIYYVLY